MLSVYQTTEGSIGDADIGESPPASAVAPQVPASGQSVGTAAVSSGSSSGTGSEGNRHLIWQILTRKFDTRRPQWYYGQVTVNAATPHEVSFEGEAVDGGFAIDDITFYDGSCQTRPKDAIVEKKPDE